MPLTIAIVGSRRYPDLERVAAYVRNIAAKHPDATIVSGGCSGPDAVGERTALECGLDVLSIRPFKDSWDDEPGVDGTFTGIRIAYLNLHRMWKAADYRERYVPPGWAFDGAKMDFPYWDATVPGAWRDAYFTRNELVVQEADIVVAFPVDSPGGTTNTINHANRLGTPLFEYVLPTPHGS